MMKSTINIILVLLIALPMPAQQLSEWIVLGHNSYKQGDVPAAILYYNKHIELKPNDPLGYLYRAKIHQANGNNYLSQLDLRIAEQLNPLSLMYINPALRSIQQAKKSYDYNFENLDENFVKSPTRLEEYKKVLQELDLGHSQDSLIEVALTYLNKKNIDKAEEVLEQIQLTNLNKAIVLDLKGKVTLKRGEYNKAEKLFLRSISHDSNFVIAYHNLSICYSLLGQHEKAIENLNKAISLKDDVSLFYFTLAKLNEINGDNNEAIENYKRALSIDIEYEEALVNYSQLLKSLGEYEEGMIYLTKAIDITNEDQKIYFEANLQFVYGEYDESLKLYESYLLKNPNDPDAIYNSGLTKILLNHHAEGCLDIEESLGLKQNNKRQNLYNLFCDNGLLFSH